ncbi:MAG: protein phosphatase [Oscillatoriales cyanobacterium RM2_1_1]|nr:protein phosphatase [Oscillatoriales cyanobacterium SM2_3_0]NJO44603.1 protein phosphatase [Oscillatoriales cyanobacterium RM2_1_1]
MTLARTSENDPILVDFLPQQSVRTRGKLGMTCAPGKKHQGMHFLWDRDLSQDLDRLQCHYRVNWLISLLEDLELEAVQIPGLFSEAHHRGIQTRRFPIPDMQIPLSMVDVVRLVQDMLVLLEQGNRVVVHCMGGLGRTGVITACCLIALGYLPEQAMALVRQTRQYTIETRPQENFIVEFSQAWIPDLENLPLVIS